MILTPGQRLATGDRTAYEVVGRGVVTARHAYYRARKRFWNYRDRDKGLYEADEDEALAVLVRVPRAPEDPGPAGAVVANDPRRLRGDLEFELGRVLGRLDWPGLPEPLDVVEGPLAPPAGAEGVPLLVLADPRAEPLAAASGAVPSIALRRLGRELLGLLDRLHAEGLVTGGLSEEGLWVSGSGSWTLMETAGIREPVAAGEARADLRLWAEVGRSLLSRCRPEEMAGPAREDFLWLADRVRRVDEGADSAAALLRDPAPARPLAVLRAAIGRWARRPPGRPGT